MNDLHTLLSTRACGLVFDIDGTLSPIAPTPSEARLYPGVAQALAEARTYTQVAIMTGRAIETGAQLVNVEGLTYIGTHGAEWSEGLPSTHPVRIEQEALHWIEPGETLLHLADQRLGQQAGVLIEHKRLGGSIHYRLAADPVYTRQLILDTLQAPAHELGFLLSEGKRVIDIKPALSINKGTALRELVRQWHLQGVLFAGDDRTDLDAMLAMRQLRTEGLQTIAVGVQAADTLPELLETADIIVQGVPGMDQLLNEIVTQLREQNK